MRPYSQHWAEAGGDEALLAIGETHFATVEDDWSAGDVLLFPLPRRTAGEACGDRDGAAPHDPRA